MGGEKKLRKAARDATKDVKNAAEVMIAVLEAAWKRPVRYSCGNCLRDAYESVVRGTNGYITDDQLMASSGNTSRRK